MIDRTTELDDELQAIAVAEMDSRGVAFDVLGAWKKFRGHHAGKSFTRATLVAKWEAWCVAERPAVAPARPVARPARDVEDVDIPLEPESPPPEFLEAALEERPTTTEYVLRHSFRRFVERHNAHATPEAALEHWLNWVRREDPSKIGPRVHGAGARDPPAASASA